MAFTGDITRFPNGVNISEPRTFGSFLKFFDPSQYFIHFDDFTTFSSEEYVAVASAFGLSNSEYGRINLTIGSVVGQRGYLTTSTVNIIPKDGKKSWSKAIFTLNNSGANNNAFVGFADSSDVDASNNRIGIFWDPTSSQLKFVWRASGGPVEEESILDISGLELFGSGADILVNISFIYDGNDRVDIFKDDKHLKRVKSSGFPEELCFPFVHSEVVNAVISALNVDAIFYGKER